MADNMVLMLLGFKDYNIEGSEDVYDKAKHYKRISLTYSGDSLLYVSYAEILYINTAKEHYW